MNASVCDPGSAADMPVNEPMSAPQRRIAVTSRVAATARDPEPCPKQEPTPDLDRKPVACMLLSNFPYSYTQEGGERFQKTFVILQSGGCAGLNQAGFP